MTPSSRTPEGDWQRCPVCGHRAAVEPSSFPVRDGPCPHCGHLMWFQPPLPEWPPLRSASLREADQYDDRATEPFAAGDRIQWIGIAAVSSLMVWLHDQSLTAAAGWLLGMIVLGQIVLAPVFRLAHRAINEANRFWLAVCCGWALAAGLPCGVLFGTLLPWLFGSGVSSVVGGIVGLVAGPILAALEGLILAALINAAFWSFTGESLTGRQGRSGSARGGGGT